MTGVPRGRGEDTRATREEALVKVGAEPPSLEETRMDPPLEPAEGAWPCVPLDFRYQASSAGREEIPAVLSHPVVAQRYNSRTKLR